MTDTITLKTIIDEDFSHYKECSMLLAMPNCSGKCWREAGASPDYCHNEHMRNMPDTQYSIYGIVRRYLTNPMSHALVFAGLEPFDNYDEMYSMIDCFAESSEDHIVIYTGYKYNEILARVEALYGLESVDGQIIIKFGRYQSDLPSKFAPELGVTLASDNQYVRG